MTSIESMLTPQVLTMLFVFWSLFAIPAALVLKKVGRHPGWAAAMPETMISPIAACGDTLLTHPQRCASWGPPLLITA